MFCCEVGLLTNLPLPLADDFVAFVGFCLFCVEKWVVVHFLL